MWVRAGLIFAFALAEDLFRDLKEFRQNFNDSCNALDQAERCETDCFNELVTCIVDCGEDEECATACYRSDIICGDSKIHFCFKF